MTLPLTPALWSLADLVLLVALGLARAPTGTLRLGGSPAPIEPSTTRWLLLVGSTGLCNPFLFCATAETWRHSLAIPANSPPGAIPSLAASLSNWGLQPLAITALLALAFSIPPRSKAARFLRRSALLLALPGWVLALLVGVHSAASLFPADATIATVSALLLALLALRRPSVEQMTLLALLLTFCLCILISIAFSALPLTALLGELWAYSKFFPTLSYPFPTPRLEPFLSGRGFALAWQLSLAIGLAPLLARWSQGRTLRAFLAAALLAPLLTRALWLAALSAMPPPSHPLAPAEPLPIASEEFFPLLAASVPDQALFFLLFTLLILRNLSEARLALASSLTLSRTQTLFIGALVLPLALLPPPLLAGLIQAASLPLAAWLTYELVQSIRSLFRQKPLCFWRKR